MVGRKQSDQDPNVCTEASFDDEVAAIYRGGGGPQMQFAAGGAHVNAATSIFHLCR